ncbi:MAG: zinc-regulated TonB-dependent outer membrane receptor [Bradymonadaceae bacterium]|nr:zinc-regulated TonB-dependent outer membrane receptor [Lujinxingiaceae bacterium]
MAVLDRISTSIRAWAVAAALLAVPASQALAEEIMAEEVVAEEVLESSEEQPPELEQGDAIEDELRALEEEVIGAPAWPEASDASVAPTGDAPRPTGPQASQSMNPDISLIADFALAGFVGDPALVGGHDPSAVGFNLQGLELAISASIDPYFRFDSAIVLGLFGLEIEEAFGTTLGLGWGFQARAGQFLTAFGRANPTHLHQWNFVTQPLVVGKFFGGEGMRGLGSELSQLLPLPWYATWRVSVQNIAGGATGRSFLGADADIETLLDLTVAGRLEQFFELGSHIDLLWGLSAANGANSSGRANRTDIFGTDLLLKWHLEGGGGHREIGWQSELLVRRRQVPADVLQDFGGYSELYWHWSPEWQIATRYEFVSGVANDYLDPDWDAARHRGTASLSYYPSHFSRLRLEYGADFLGYREAPADRLVHMVFLQLELVAGAHGAHTY